MSSTLFVDAIEPNLSGGVHIAGHVIQVVNNTNASHSEFSSGAWTQTSLSVSITPVFTTSKFLISANCYGGVNSQDVSVAFTFYDTLNPQADGIAPLNLSGGTASYSANERLSAFFGIPSWAASAASDNWYIGLASGEYLYTPPYQNLTTRTFGTVVRTSFGGIFRENMNGQNNASEPRDIRFRSTITVTEIAQ